MLYGTTSSLSKCMEPKTSDYSSLPVTSKAISPPINSSFVSSSSSATPPTQQLTPDFLFGSRDKRRNLVVKDSNSSSQYERSAFISPLSAELISTLESKNVRWHPVSTYVNRTTPVTADPPLHLLREEIRPMEISDARVTAPMNSSTQCEEVSSSNWVTVFGFSREDASDVLKIFSRHGAIVQHQFAKDGNWVNLRYASSIHALQALSRNGQVVDGRMRLGVVPTESEEIHHLDVSTSTKIPVNYSSENMNEAYLRHSLFSNGSLLLGLAPLSSLNKSPIVQDSHLCTALNSSNVRSSIRSLRAAYNCADNQIRVDKKEQPEKSKGLFERLWSYVS